MSGRRESLRIMLEHTSDGVVIALDIGQVDDKPGAELIVIHCARWFPFELRRKCAFEALQTHMESIVRPGESVLITDELDSNDRMGVSLPIEPLIEYRPGMSALTKPGTDSDADYARSFRAIAKTLDESVDMHLPDTSYPMDRDRYMAIKAMILALRHELDDRWIYSRKDGFDD